MEDRLVHELQDLLEACERRGVEVFVIGGYGVRAYGSLLRRTLDLDLAVDLKAWPELAAVLETQGYRLSPADIWATAIKGEGENAVEVHIALGKVIDVQSALGYPVEVDRGDRRSLPDVHIVLPVFTLEGLLITKLIALRDNDVVDIVALLTQHADRVNIARFWQQTAAARLVSPITGRLSDLEEMLQSGEVDAIWWDRLGLMLDDGDRQITLKAIRQLQRSM